MEIVVFKAEHLGNLDLQDAQIDLAELIDLPGYAHSIEQAGNAFSVLHEGRVIACGGLMEIWPGRAMIWAFMSKLAGPHMRTLHRAVLGYLHQANWQRIEAYAASEFPQGQRWLEMLGFKHEGTMRKFSHTGQDHELYSRVK